jgi:hypothetical protein
MKITFGFAIKCIDVIEKLSILAPHPLKTIKPCPPHPKKRTPLEWEKFAFVPTQNTLGICENNPLGRENPQTPFHLISPNPALEKQIPSNPPKKQIPWNDDSNKPNRVNISCPCVVVAPNQPNTMDDMHIHRPLSSS